MASHPLIFQLAVLRRSIRARLAVYGICAMLASGVLLCLAVLTLDWLFWFPPLLRLLLAIGAVAATAAAAWYWLIQPIRAPLDMEALAGQLEHCFPSVRNDLVSAVHFLRVRPETSPGLAQAVVDRAAHAVNALDLREALSMRPVVRCAAVLLVSILPLVVVQFGAPSWLMIGMARHLDPFGGAIWPPRVEILSHMADQTVAIGETVPVQLTITRGQDDALRPLVVMNDADQQRTTLALQRGGGARYVATIDAVTTDLACWFTAGDASTQDRPFAIRVVPRPEVVEALAKVSPPDYVAHRPTRIVDLADGPADVVSGSRVTVRIRTSKPVPCDEQHAVLVRREASPLPLANDDGTLTTELLVTEDLHLRAQLIDEHGIENRGVAEYTLHAIADRKPQVTLLAPRGPVEATARAVVPIQAQLRDDFDIASVTLSVADQSGHVQQTMKLRADTAVTYTPQSCTATLAHDWALASLDLAPGHILTATLTAHDNAPTEDMQGQPSPPTTIHVRIISDEELDTRLRDDLAAMQRHLRNIALEQGTIADRLAELPHAEQASGADGALSASMEPLARRQDRAARRTLQTADHIASLARRARLSGATQERVEPVNQAASSIADTVALSMSQASAQLAAAATPGISSHEASEATASATAHARQAYEQLQAVLEAMAQWGAFSGLVAKTRDLIDRQEAIREETATLGQTLLGRDVDTLSPAHLAGIKAHQRKQQQLAGDIDTTLKHMRTLTENSDDDDPIIAETLEDALRIARAHSVTAHAHDAARAIGVNRTAAAAIQQRAVISALHKMEAALRRRQQRALAHLRKQLTDASEQIAQLITEQQELQAATQEAALLEPQVADVATLAAGQYQLATNTSLLGQELLTRGATHMVGDVVRGASIPMKSAATSLEHSQVREAPPRQGEAVVILQDALDILARQQEAARQEALRLSLTDVRDKLSDVLEGQQEVNSELTELASAVSTRGRLIRQDIRQAKRLASDQEELAKKLDTCRQEVAEAVVYNWALTRAAGWMDDIQVGLRDRDVNEQLVRLGDRVAHELVTLIGAIEDTLALPKESDFADSGDGGGGGANGPAAHQTQNPIPTVAELLVLKAIQHDISKRTQMMATTFDPEHATEDDLRRLAEIGDDQSELRQLAQRVASRARQN